MMRRSGRRVELVLLAVLVALALGVMSMYYSFTLKAEERHGTHAAAGELRLASADKAAPQQRVQAARGSANKLRAAHGAKSLAILLHPPTPTPSVPYTPEPTAENVDVDDQQQQKATAAEQVDIDAKREATAPMTPAEAQKAGLRPTPPAAPPYLSMSERLGKAGTVYRDCPNHDSNQRMRFHQISPHSPRLDYVEGFWTDEETEQVLAIAQKKLARSTVVGEKTGAVSTSRTSQGMFITGSEHWSALIVAARERVSLMTGLPIENIEATQVLRYEPGQQYVAHPDFFSEFGASKEHLSRGGQRVATVLAWLNDVEAGGNTSFPSSRNPGNDDKPYSVAPKKGDAIVFWDCVKDMKPDKVWCTPDHHSQHWGMPPEKGMKWVSVFWVRQHEFH